MVFVTAHKSATAFLLVMLIAGQSLIAVTAPCGPVDSVAQFASSDMDHSMHAGHGMSQPDSTKAADAGCCDAGYCSVNGCLSLAALPDSGLAASSPWLELFPASHQLILLSHLPPSLFRPPSIS